MPVESKKNIRNKILERVENTAAFSKEKRTTTDTIPNMCCEKKLVDAHR